MYCMGSSLIRSSDAHESKLQVSFMSGKPQISSIGGGFTPGGGLGGEG
jgi:hypothetical protein